MYFVVPYVGMILMEAGCMDQLCIGSDWWEKMWPKALTLSW